MTAETEDATRRERRSPVPMGVSSRTAGPGALRAAGGNTPHGLFGLLIGAGTATGRDAVRATGDTWLLVAAGPRGAVACAAVEYGGRDWLNAVALLGTLEWLASSIGDGWKRGDTERPFGRLAGCGMVGPEGLEAPPRPLSVLLKACPILGIGCAGVGRDFAACENEVTSAAECEAVGVFLRW